MQYELKFVNKTQKYHDKLVFTILLNKQTRTTLLEI